MRSPFAEETFRKANVVAALIAALGLAVVYTSFDPVPAGADISEVPNEPEEFVLNEVTVPLPREAAELSGLLAPAANSSGSEEFHSVESTPVAAPTAAAHTADGALLNSLEAIQYSVYLLQDGESLLQSSPSYSAVFSKQERIQGDLGDTQTIDLKVQHTPHFSVYMKWRNGDAGRQVLYSEQYEDRQMVVKLGGLKGRLIPAIKLDPNGERAMSEARHPVTNAGILGMQRKLLAHRRADIARGYGVRCRRLPDQQFDENHCICFEYLYDSAEISPVYRKSVVLIDARKHVSLLTRNYTWTAESEGLSTEELDQQTLIENYSFSSVNFGAALLAEDFSRDNPRYRM